jgi:hypothetical protein
MEKANSRPKVQNEICDEKEKKAARSNGARRSLEAADACLSSIRSRRSIRAASRREDEQEMKKQASRAVFGRPRREKGRD